MKANRRGFMGMGLGGILAGPSAAKQMVSDMKSPAVGGAPQPAGYYSEGLNQAVSTKEMILSDVQAELDSYKKRLARGFLDEEDIYRYNKNIRAAAKGAQLDSFKSVSKSVRIMWGYDYDMREQEKFSIWDTKRAMQKYFNRWVGKFPGLRL